MPVKTRAAIVLVALLILPGFATTVSASSVVELENPIWLADADLGLEVVAAGGSSTQKILIAGADGYARLLDGENPREQIELATLTEETLRAISWHPRGNTALLAGDGGTLLRYAAEDYSVTTVSGSGQLNGVDLTSVSWNAAGTDAYIGGVDGWIWAYHEGEDGIGVFTLLEDTKSNSISGIACHAEVNVCVAATSGDGVAIIDTRDGHTLHWIGGLDNRWNGVNCGEPNWYRCIAIGEHQNIGRIGIEIDDVDRSTILIQRIPSITGEFTHVNTRVSSEALITLAPFEVMAWDIDDAEAYEWVDHTTVVESSSALAGERLVGSWGTVDNPDIGFLVTSYGAIIGFHPPVESNPWASDTVTYILGGLVIIAVPGVAFGLIFMNSETLQRKYYARRAAKREAADAARVEAEKAVKKSERAAKKS
ncbi:MAG TPA: hypothetical protein EYQ80_06050 [Candidatus Poseidoniales archaeon]|nr:hypothetical protein [Candidatus Poseidoniales archaeon]